MRYRDDFTQKVLDGVAGKRDRTVVLACPGSGKTLAYQAAATRLRREHGVDYVAVFVPRLMLAKQCETKWLHRLGDGTAGGDHLMFDAAGRMGSIQHISNQIPLLPPGRTGIGFVSTYSALVRNPAIYESWARTHAGRFLLVADEAQFCGDGDEKGGGTLAGALVEELHQYSAHTLLLTGTPYRSDGQPLILAEYDEPDERGRRQLLCEAEASYADGIAEGYLRRFEATRHDARVRERQMDDSVVEYDLSTDGEYLREILRRPGVWQPIADDVVAAVREKQRLNPGYRGLISCMEQKDARRVAEYLDGKYNKYGPRLRVALAISDDGAAGEQETKDFRDVGGDILVTVRKAFIGYDCPQITVVGVLTNYRDKGHLMQLVGRGLRTWGGAGGNPRSQSCRIITTDDPQMDTFVAFLQGEQDEGLAERARRDSGPRSSSDEDPLAWIEDAHTTTARASSNDVELENDELLLIRSIKYDLGLTDDDTQLAKFLQQYGHNQAAPPPPREEESGPPTAAPLTERERIKEVNSQTATEIRSYLADQSIQPDHPAYRERIARVTAAVNEASCKAADARTVEQAEARLRAAQSLRASAR